MGKIWQRINSNFYEFILRLFVFIGLDTDMGNTDFVLYGHLSVKIERCLSGFCPGELGGLL